MVYVVLSFVRVGRSAYLKAVTFLAINMSKDDLKLLKPQKNLQHLDHLPYAALSSALPCQPHFFFFYFSFKVLVGSGKSRCMILSLSIIVNGATVLLTEAI